MLPANPTSSAFARLRHRCRLSLCQQSTLEHNGLPRSCAATLCVALERGTVSERLDALRATFEKSRHRYAFRRRAVIEEMFALAATELHMNALGETLKAWLPSIESFDYSMPTFPHAMAA